MFVQSPGLHNAIHYCDTLSSSVLLRSLETWGECERGYVCMASLWQGHRGMFNIQPTIVVVIAQLTMC